MAKTDFVLKSSLTQIFLRSFALAVLLPVFFVINSGHDAYLQTKELLPREVFAKQNQRVRNLERVYSKYLSQLQRLGIEFYKKLGTRKYRFKGSKNSNLWFNETQDFFHKLASHPHALQYRLSYHKHANLYRSFVHEKFVVDSKIPNEWSHPFKAQVFVMEKSFFPPGHFTFSDLFPDAKTMGFSNDQQRMQYLQKRGLWNIFRALPLHPVFQSTQNPLINLLWKDATFFSQQFMRLVVFGHDFIGQEVDSSKLLEFLHKMRGRYFPMKIGTNYDTCFDFYPTDFEYSKYRNLTEGLVQPTEAPTAVYIGVVDKPAATKMFLEFFREKKVHSYFAEIVEELRQFKRKLRSSQTSLEFVKYTLKDDFNPVTKFLLPVSFFPDRGTKNWENQPYSGDYKGKDHHLEIFQLMRIYNRKTGEYQFEKEELLNLLNQTLSESGSIITPGINHLIQAMDKLKKPFHFTYISPETSKKMLGTIYPSRVFDNFCYFLSQPEEFLLAPERRKNQALILGPIALILCILWFIGRKMSQRIVNPITRLTTNIAHLVRGEYYRKVEVSLHNEIGALGFHFNEMAANIQNRLFQIKTVHGLNLRMNLGFSRHQLLSHILEELGNYYQAEAGILGFFEQEYPRSISEYSVYSPPGNSWNPPSNLLEALIENLIPTTAVDTVVFLNEHQLKEMCLPFRNAVIYRVFEKVEEHKLVSVRGLLLLANVNEWIQREGLEVLGGQAKTVVLKTYLDELNQDVQQGQEIQRGLIPRTVPAAQGLLDLGTSYSAARGLAGDYFDFLPFSDQRYLGFTIADVAGKGVGPALFGASAKASMKLLSQNPDQTGPTLERLNALLYRDEQSHLFLTMFYCVIDFKNLKLYYSSAGHNKMLLLKENGLLQHLNARGIPIGIFSESSYETRCQDLEPGDSLIFYTDGVTELEDIHRHLFGLNRLEDFCRENRKVPAKKWVELLDSKLEEHRNGLYPSDDITFVLMQIINPLSPDVQRNQEC